MNKKCFRVIFSKTLQRLVVTSELAKSEGKSNEASDGFSLPSLQLLVQLRPLTFSLFCALGFVAFSDNALAETLIIQADKSAPKNQQPIILQTANGLPQVNIQTPNEKGLSHNKYSKFDVDTKGAILNNSRKNSQTQQAGWVQGNPYLARGEAKVILNEVNSNDPSVLKGYVEVAGKKADVIIANPSGLHCDGCGIINSDRVTLTTGKPHIQHGNLDSFVVEKGKVNVSGKGLDNSRVDYTDILAREVKANAGIWSKKETKIITGKNTIKRSDSGKNLQIIHTNQPLAEEAKPQFAVDVGELGGMYSGKIHLIGTENGVGVRNAGHIGASAETLKIDSKGRIVNTGTLNSNQALDLTATKGIENQGKIENRQGNIQLTTKADIKQDGSVVARQGNIHKKAEKAITQQGETVAKGDIRYTASSVDASTSSLIAAGVNVKDSEKGEVRELENQSAQGKSIQITTSNKATLQGKNIAPNKVQVNATEVNLDKSQTSAHTIEVKASQGDIQANEATFTAQEHLQLKTPKTLSTQSSHLSAKVIDTEQQFLNAANAVWKQTGESDFRLKGDSINTAGSIFSTRGNLLVQAQQLDNTQGTLSTEKSLMLNVSEHINSTNGQLVANENLKITSGSVNNDRGLIYAKQNVTLNSVGNISNQNTNVDKKGIVAGQALWLNGKTIDNTQGKIASQVLTLKATQANNTEGLIQTKERLNLNLAKLANHRGILTSGNEARLVLDQLEQESGHIESETLSLTANRISSTNGSLIFAKNLNITTTDGLNNQDSRIVSKDNGSLAIGSHLNNENGIIGSQTGSLTLNVVDHNITNKQGKIVAAQQVNLQSSMLNNEQGLISAKNIDLNVSHSINNENTLSPDNRKGIVAQADLNIRAPNINNDQGNVYSHQNLHLTSNNLFNHAGNLFSGKDSYFTTSALNNDKGKINVGGRLDLNAETVSQAAGLIKAKVLNLVSTQVSSTQKSEISGNQITAKVNAFNNNGSVIVAQQNMVMDAKKGIQNQQGTVASLEGSLSINTHQSALNNTQGIIASQNADLQLQTGKIDNQQGSIRAKQATINTHQQTLDNSNTLANREQGIIVDDLTLVTKKLDNQQGRVIAKNRGDMVAQATHNQSGEILVQHSAKITSSEVDNQAGVIASIKGDLDLVTSSVLNNQQGQISAAEQLILDTQGLANQNGQISSHQLTLNTHQQEINNQHGRIVTQQRGKIESGTLNNQHGLIRADQSLSVNANNQHIDNRHTQGKNQGIISLGNIVLEAVANLQNQAGTLYANHSLNVDIQNNINNIEGIIQSNQKLTLSAKTMDNRAGSISTKSGLIATEQLNNRATSATGSFILADELTLNVQHLDNQGTKAKGNVPEQGLQASNLTLNVNTLNNQQGGIYTQNIANITAKNRLANQQGELLSGNAIEIKHDGNLMVNNQDGLIQGHRLIHLNAKGLESEGAIKIEGDLAVSLKDSFTLNKAFEVGNNLTFKTEGDFENNVIQAVKNKAIFTANRITNNANAEISAQETQINSSELTNRGLIDGYKTRINSTNVTNIGTGRIYGNYLAFKAENIANLRETVNGETKSATIAAREKLDFGVGTLTNRDHSLILSLGRLNIGGDLDKDGNTIGKAIFVDNGSATIEVFADGEIHSERLLNHDLYLKKGIDTTTENINEHALGENSHRYREGRDGYYNINNGSRNPNSYFELKNGKRIEGFGWYSWFYTQTTNTTTLEHTDAAKISVGGTLKLNGDNLHNKYSQLLVGKQLWLGDSIFSENPQNKSLNSSKVTLNNEDIIGEINKTNEGTYRIEHRVRKKKGRNGHYHYHHNGLKYGPEALPTEYFAFNRVLNTIGQKLNLNQTIESQVSAKDVNIENITINTKDNLAIDTISQSNPTIKSNDSIHIVLTPAIDDKDKNNVIYSGQVIGKLDTTIDGNEIKDFGNLKLPTIKTHLADITVPTSSLYRINPDHPQGYLVETDPKFTQREQWLSSDYLLDQLRYDHNLTHKRLGDGFYEQRLINEQINQLTGRRFIQGYSSDLAQYKALMNSGVKYAKQFNLAVGVGLTAQQMSELTTDMVWLVNKEVTLPNGQKVTALTPQVYLVARNSDITSRGAVISANEIVGNVGALKNSGVIAGRDLTRIHSNQLENRGVILGDTVDLNATQSLVNLGGRIEAVNQATLASKHLEIASTLSHSKSDDGNFERTIVDQIGSVKVTGANGTLSLKGGDSLTIKGALIQSNGTARAESDNLNITTLQIQNKEHYNGDANNYYRLDKKAEVGTQISGKNGVTLIGKQDVKLRQAAMTSENGNVSVVSQHGNVTLEAGHAEESLSTSVKSTSKGLLSKRTSLSQHDHQTDVAVVNSLQGQNVTLYSGKALIDEGSEILATDNIYLEGKNGVALNSVQNTRSERNHTEMKKSGLTASFSNGVARVGVGRSKQKDRNTEIRTTHISSKLNAQNGNITVVSTQGDVTANATKFDSKKDITVEGKNVHLNAEVDEKENAQSHSSSSKGFGIGVVYNPVATFKSRYGEQSSQGSAGSIVGKAITAGDALDKTSHQLSRPAAPYLAANKTQNERFAHAETANVVEMNAGGNLSLRATKGNITSQGAHLTAQGDGKLSAKENIDFGVVTTEQSQTSRRKQKGIDIDSSRRLTEVVGAYHGKEKGDGNLIQEHASILSFGGKGTLEAEKGDVTLAGTQFVSNDGIKISAGNDVLMKTTKTIQTQDESSKNHGFGEAVVSETERFSGYNRKLSSQDGKSVEHQGSMVASLNGRVDIYSGKDFQQTSGKVFAKDKIKISAEKITTDAEHNTQQHSSHQSDLKVGQFTRVISPVIDLINAVESSVKNKDASDRVKAAQLIGLAAQGYNLNNALNHDDKAVLFRVETGIGLSHSRQSQNGESRESVGNQFNAKQIEMEARSGKISAIHTDFTARDKEGNRLADSEISLSAKQGIDLNAGESQYKNRAKNQSYGTEVGTAFSVGAKTGWSFYAKEGFSKGKQESEGKTNQNSHLDAQTINIKSGGDVNLNGTKATANSINADIKGNLNITSVQDEHKQKSNQIGLGTKVEFGFGSAWEFSGNVSAEGGKSNAKQVNEQSGLFAEEGGYHINANNVHLKGGAITSTNPANSELTTNKLTFEDIQNSSSYSATSGAISGGYSQSSSTSVNPSLPMHEQGQDSSITKATLTEGKITLNKDSQPTETTAAALGINTDISQTNKQVKAPKDVNQLLKEQKVIRENVGHIATAASNFSTQQAKGLEEEAKEAEKAGDHQTAKAKREEAKSWETGGENKRKVDAITTALSLALAGQSPQAIATGAASPYINQAIKEATENYPELNIPAHILWGAIEAELTGGKATTGAIAGGVGELAAPILSQALYGNKKTNELTDAEKQQVLNLSKLVAGIASGLTATGNSAENIVTISQGMKVAENAVENNSLLVDRFRENKKADAERWKENVRETLGEGTPSQVINGVINLIEETSDGALFVLDGAFDAFSVITTCALGDSYCSQAKQDLAGKSEAISSSVNTLMSGEYWESVKDKAQKAYQGDQKALEDFSGMVAGLILPIKAAPNKSKLADFSYKVPDEINSGKQLPLVGKTAGYEYENINILGYSATSNVAKLQLRTELAFKDANILNINGLLTEEAIKNSKIIPLGDGVIKNPKVVSVLTRDGSKIEDWDKMTTKSIKMPNGQSMQIHFYRNNKTGKVDYETKDFKVKGEVKP